MLMMNIICAATNSIQFPKLGIDLNIDTEAFSLFGLSIKWYGVLIGLGLLLAMIYCFRRNEEFGIESDRLTDTVIAGFFGAVIGARLYYVILHADSYNDITEVLAIRDGGLAIYGGILGALLAGFVTAKIRKLRVLPVFDLASMGLLIGQCIGRWGNFVNQEAFGSNTSLPWGMTGGRIQRYLANHQAELALKGIEVDPTLPVHPCFLYESIWCLVGFILLHSYYKKRKFDGEIFAMYVFWYGAGRFFIEGLRTDSLYIGSIRASQLLAAISAIAALVFIIVMRIRAKKTAPVLYRDTEESKHLIEQGRQKDKDYAEKKKNKKKKELTADQKIIGDDDAQGK